MIEFSYGISSLVMLDRVPSISSSRIKLLTKDYFTCSFELKTHAIAVQKKNSAEKKNSATSISIYIYILNNKHRTET